ncbi:hypothetical protein AGMMS50293_06520 [Spirochaetia bacterium]|nr:hypothetical protein AGMMS50293_06520 [Spirochaetia bacterium]
MILKTRRHSPLTLLVLVPHRDARLLLRRWSGTLFSAGCPGAWSFPWAAPLALLSRPLSVGELKHCAHILREESLTAGKNGKIKTGPAAFAAFPQGSLPGEDAAIFGPVLNLEIPDSSFTANAAAKIIHRFSLPTLGAALVRYSGDASAAAARNAAVGGADFPPAPQLSFRAAALANMSYRPLFSIEGAMPDSAYSFEWRISELHWLPPVRKS